MKIILLANDEQKAELLAQQPGMPAELVWRNELSLADLPAADACIDLLFDDTAERLNQLQRLASPIVIINSMMQLSDELTGFARINGWNTFLKRPVIEATGPAALQQKTSEIFSLFNKKTEWVADISGFISARVVASVINEAFFALDEKVSSKEEIDIAMKLGTNYPYGPFEWSKRIGIKKIYNLLNHLSEQQKRYEPSVLLKKEAVL
jgi:3-hydroxybutyryl-CoA dehydrogenase